MAVNEIPQPGLTTTAIQRDKEILYSMEGLFQKGGTFAADPTGGPNSDGVLPSGQVVAELADGTYVEYNGGATPVANEVQTVTISATGGTFTLTVLGSVTTAIPYGASGPAVRSAIAAAIPAATEDDFSVSKAADVYTITFKGQYSAKNQATIVTGAGSLTGGASTAVVATVTQGSPGTADGSAKAVGVLRSPLDVSSGPTPGNILFGGTLKLNQLVGWSDDAAQDLKARVNTARNFVKF